MRHTVLIVFLLSILFTNVAYAAEMEIDMQSYFRVVWGLAVVVALMLGIYYLVRRRFSPLHGKADRIITVVEIQPIMPKKSLCLVKVHGREILLGITQDSITTITEFTDNQDKPSSFAERLTESTINKEKGSNKEHDNQLPK